MVEVALALGSNLGNREELLKKAVDALEKEVGSILTISAFIETIPEGFTSSNPFLNGAIVLRTDLTPQSLLKITQAIEKRLGRKTKRLHGESYTDRSIDIDLLLYDEEVINCQMPFLQIPHPRMDKRSFVLTPLASILPLARHPLRYATILDLQHCLSIPSSSYQGA